jgi:pimeloyl-ACP methyl ester carboxylesterase
MHSSASASIRTIIIAASFFFCSSILHAEESDFISAGTRIHYIVEGKGEPVLLIHGFGLSLQKCWLDTGIIKALADKYKVIAMDVRGHGKSDKPHNPAAYGEETVNDVVRLLDHLKIKKAHLVGYSMGGMITCSMLGYHPKRVLSAVIGGAGWYPPEEDPIPALRQQLADSLEKGNGIGPLILSLTPKGASPPSPEQIAMVNRSFLSGNDALALAALQRNSFQPPSAAQLRISKVSVLALIGEFDPRKSGVDKINALLPGMKVVVIPGANHMTAYQHPEFIKNLRAFLDEHTQARP